MTTNQPFTEQQMTAIRELVADAVHEAVAPIAKQTTAWIERERARLTEPRRTWTGRPIGATPPARTDPTPSKPPPPVAPDVHVFDGHQGRG